MKKAILFVLVVLIFGGLGHSQSNIKVPKVDTTVATLMLNSNTDSSIVIIRLGGEKENEKEEKSFLEKYLPLLLSILAAVISVFTLYFTQLRKGRLIIGLPNRFLITTTNHHPTFEITIVLVNSGVQPVVINHINLVSRKNSKIVFKIPVAEFTVDELQIENGSLEVAYKKSRELAKSIILNGSEKTILTLSFNEGNLFYTFMDGNYGFVLEFLLNNNVNKRKKIEFIINIDEDDIDDFYSESSITEQVEKNRFIGKYKLINNVGKEIILPEEKKNTEQTKA